MNSPPPLIKQKTVVIDEPVEFEKLPIEVQDFKKITDRCRGIYE